MASEKKSNAKPQRNEDRYVEAMRAINDRAEVFLVITSERPKPGEMPELKIYASDDYSHERLFNAALSELPFTFPFVGEVIEAEEKNGDDPRDIDDDDDRD